MGATSRSPLEEVFRCGTLFIRSELWESGQTKDGCQYLRSIAEAFAVTEDLHLLLHAWVLDQLYGNVVHEGTAARGRALLVHGIDEKPAAIDLSNVSPAMADGNTYLTLADDLDTGGARADQPVVAGSPREPLWTLAGSPSCRRRSAHLGAKSRIRAICLRWLL
ncbi:MAG: hypothetical protein U0904_05130 [Candidatus Nanopelagicales bacterium]|nr:hypothetical protein [Candidatus Nanopelagicales bacterium]